MRGEEEMAKGDCGCNPADNSEILSVVDSIVAETGREKEKPYP